MTFFAKQLFLTFEQIDMNQLEINSTLFDLKIS